MSAREIERRCKSDGCGQKLVLIKDITGCPKCDHAYLWPNVGRA